MLQINPVYILLIILIVFLMKIIDCGQLIIKQRVSFNPILNGIYYVIGLFSLLVIITMFNEKGLIYHRLMVVILFALTAFIFLPSVFVKPTVNSLISTAVGTFLALFFGIFIFFTNDSPQNGILIGFVVYMLIFLLIGAIFHNILNLTHKKGKEVLFYKQKLWELLNDRRLLVPVFVLICIEFGLHFFGYTILNFLPF